MCYWISPKCEYPRRITKWKEHTEPVRSDRAEVREDTAGEMPTCTRAVTPSLFIKRSTPFNFGWTSLLLTFSATKAQPSKGKCKDERAEDHPTRKAEAKPARKPRLAESKAQAVESKTQAAESKAKVAKRKAKVKVPRLDEGKQTRAAKQRRGSQACKAGKAKRKVGEGEGTKTCQDVPRSNPTRRKTYARSPAFRKCGTQKCFHSQRTKKSKISNPRVPKVTPRMGGARAQSLKFQPKMNVLRTCFRPKAYIKRHQCSGPISHNQEPDSALVQEYGTPDAHPSRSTASTPRRVTKSGSGSFRRVESEVFPEGGWSLHKMCSVSALAWDLLSYLSFLERVCVG